MFSEFGPIKKCKLIRCIVTGESKRYAFVEYEEKVGAYTAYRKGHKTKLNDSSLLVDYECEHILPHWIPRRLGKLNMPFVNTACLQILASKII